jgi:endoglucanase
MKKLLSFIIIFLLVFVNTFAQNELESNETILRIEKKLKENGLGRYMEGTEISTISDLKNWEGEPLKRYKYSINDKLSGKLTADVITYNADEKRLANWIYFALSDSKKTITDNNINKVINYIKGTSGFQFPVRGIVYEDIYCKICGCITYDSCKKAGKPELCLPDNIFEAYTFFDGITIKHKSIKPTICDYTSPIRITESENETLLKMTESDISWVGNFSRISTTSAAVYNIFMKKFYAQKVDFKPNTIQFLQQVRKEYKQAMHSNRNNLISAWVYSQENF